MSVCMLSQHVLHHKFPALRLVQMVDRLKRRSKINIISRNRKCNFCISGLFRLWRCAGDWTHLAQRLFYLSGVSSSGYSIMLDIFENY